MKDAVETLKYFIGEILTERNIKTAASCLSDDVLCIDTEQAEMSRGISSATALLSDFIHSMPSPFRISFHEIERKLDPDGSGYVYLGMDAYPGSSKFPTYVRLSANIRNEYGTNHICFFHISIPSKLDLNNRPESVLDSVPCGIAVFRLSSKGAETLFLNRNVYRYFACDKGESIDLRSFNYLEHVHPDDRQSLSNMFMRSARVSNIISDSFRIMRADHEYRWINMHFTSVAETDHSQIIYITLNDTEDMRLLEGKKLLYDKNTCGEAMSPDVLSSLLVDLSSGDISEINGSDMIINYDDCNGKYDRYIALSAEKIPHEKSSEKFCRIFSRENLLKELDAGNTSVSFDFISSIRNGIASWLRCTMNMIRRPVDDRISGLLFIRDITNDRINDHIIKKIIEKQYDLTCIVDGDLNSYRIVSAFSPVREVVSDYGNDYEEKMADLISTYSSMGPSDPMIEALRTGNIRMALKGSESIAHFGTFILSDGSMSYKKIQLNSIDRDTNTFAIVITDYTSAQKSSLEQQELVLSSLESATAANRAKNEFLSKMSHEIRTPINSIIGLTEIMMDDASFPHTYFDRLSKISNSSRSLLKLVNNILTMSDIESGHVTVNSAPFCLSDSVKELCRNISGQCQLGGLTFSFDTDSSIPPRVNGDAAKVRQFLSNILDNAVKFTPRGGHISLNISVLKQSDEAIDVQFTVTDTGIGISDSFLPRIFIPFAQENSGISSSYGGTGLGLPITKNIISLMGGTIDIQSKKNSGTTVTVCIPFEKEQNRSDTDDDNAADSEIFDFTGRHILIAEDNTLNIEILKYELSAKNAEMQFVPDGLAALNAFKDSPVGFFSCILMDIRMPNMDGLEAASKIRGLEKADGLTVPIIAMSAGSSDDDEKQALEAGMNALLIKPVNSTKLYRTLNRHIR